MPTSIDAVMFSLRTTVSCGTLALMLYHQTRVGDLSPRAVDEFDERLSNLPEGFRRVLFPAHQSIANLLGIHERESSDYRLGYSLREHITNDRIMHAEVIATDTHLFVVNAGGPSPGFSGFMPEDEEYQELLTSRRLAVHSFGPAQQSGELDRLVKHLEKAFSTQLIATKHSSQKFEDLKAEGRVPPRMPSNEDIAGASVLADRATRRLAIALKQSGGLHTGSIGKQLPPSDRSRAEEICNSLETCGIVASETVVICTKTSAQVAKVPDASVLADLAARGLRCACGNAISDETIDIALSVSERGRSLLDGNLWFTILLINDLVDLGVLIDQILVDQVSGGSEMDCIADMSGEIALFELKDKEFNLGNAYSFGAKIGIIAPDHPIIVTSEYVGEDAKEHFSKTRQLRRDETWSYPSGELPDSGPTVKYIEGISSLRPELEKLITEIMLREAKVIFDEVLPFGTVSTDAVLKSLNARLTVNDSL